MVGLFCIVIVCLTLLLHRLLQHTHVTVYIVYIGLTWRYRLTRWSDSRSRSIPTLLILHICENCVVVFRVRSFFNAGVVVLSIPILLVHFMAGGPSRGEE